jgi:hypothetical protein
VKKYADNLLLVFDSVAGRLSKLESSTQRLEHLFGEVKDVVAATHVDADGKFRSLESHILEVSVSRLSVVSFLFTANWKSTCI